jgi:flagellar biosynthesis component FlhA
MPSRIQRTAVCLLTACMLAMPSAMLLTRPAAAHAAPEEKKVKKSELNNHMEDIDDMMKKLRRSIRKPENNEESLKTIADIEQLMVTCKSLTPTKAEKVPEAERAKFVTAYRKQMANVLGIFCQMEAALCDGDNKKAQELYKTITTEEDKDHDQFMQKDEKKKE